MINFIIFTEPKVTEDSITFYGAGKFNETALVLNKKQAMLAYIELHKFLFLDNKENDNEQNKN